MRVLGADIFVEVAVRGLAVQLSEKKAKKWKNELEVWQRKKKMPQSVAAQFAGRLSFSVTVTASKCGRAFMRPF